jgi:hypothetical protein
LGCANLNQLSPPAEASSPIYYRDNRRNDARHETGEETENPRKARSTALIRAGVGIDD